MTYSFYDLSKRELRQALKRADMSVFDESLRFLEDDPRTFRSGYIREIIWKYIKRFPLSQDHITRLERVALKYLERPMSREFKYMCQTMTHLATSEFWETVKLLCESDIPRIQVNAYCLYAYSKGIYAGEKQRLELDRLRGDITRRFYHDYRYISFDEQLRKLSALIRSPENWSDGYVVHREANSDDLPVIYYLPTYDQEFATLDMSKCKPDIMLPKLKQVLMTGYMVTGMEATWLYALYLIGQIRNDDIVSILAEFMESKFAYKFEGIKKSLLEIAVLRIIKDYSTPEAIEIMNKYQKEDQEYTDYYKGRGHGWLLRYP